MNNEEIFEYQILAATFTVPGAIQKFTEELDPVNVGLIHGYTGIHEIYKSLISYHSQIDTEMIDPVAFKSWLQSETEIVEAVGGVTVLDELFSQVMNVELSSVESIIKLTNFRANKRRQLDKLQELKHLITKKGQMTEDDKNKIGTLTEQIRELERDLEYNPLASVRTANDIAEDTDSLWDIPPFLPTQFPALNQALGYSAETGGIPRAAITTIVALSGYGKSTLARCLCNYWLDCGEVVLFINFEETKSHWERTLMTQLTQTNIYAEAQDISEAKKLELTKQFKKKLAQWGDNLMIRHDPDTLFFEDLENWLRDILGHGVKKPTVVVIDTIQSMFTKSGGRARWGEFEQIMVRLEKLAKDMDAAFVLTAQQNINSTKEKREVVNQSDMGGSVTITQKSSVVMFLTPMKDATGDETFSETLMQVQIPKNRITGTVFASNPPIIQYDDRIKSYINFDPNILDGVGAYDMETLDMAYGELNPT
jgi:replicative DNA helicase